MKRADAANMCSRYQDTELTRYKLGSKKRLAQNPGQLGYPSGTLLWLREEAYRQLAAKQEPAGLMIIAHLTHQCNHYHRGSSQWGPCLHGSVHS